MRVLIADDEDVTRTLLRRMLEKQGHDVLECRDGREAIAALSAPKPPQLALVDWMMPEMTGPEVCAQIRKRADQPFIYLILVTSRDGKDDVLSGLRTGANDYLTKPFSVAELESRIEVAKQTIDLHQTIERQRLKMISSAKMAVLGEMAGGIAHEINNPLTIIVSHAYRLLERLKGGTLDVDYQQKAYEVMHRTALRIAQIVTALRAFAVEEDREPFQVVQVKKLLGDVRLFCEARLGHHQVDLRISDVPDSWVFEGQPVQIAQVLLNLIENAFHAIQSFKKKWIEVDVQEDAQNITFSVTDCGHGIPVEIRSKIMQPFFTTKAVGKGTGLGLSLSTGIVASHHGELMLDETSPHTRFVIRVPKLQPRSKQVRAA